MRPDYAFRRVGSSSLRLLAAALLVFVTLGAAVAVQLDTDRLLRLAKSRYGQPGVTAVESWLTLLDQSRDLSETDKLRTVNGFWNETVRGVDDIDVWKKTDYWATPLETLGKRAGDCEDYVIGKYFSLLKLGVPAQNLRLIYVRARVGGKTIAHMVLGYYENPAADPLILDSLTSSMSRASARSDLTPVFSFNAQGVYVSGQERSVEGISRWQNLLLRMTEEGIQP